VRILHVSDLHFGPPFVPRVAEALVAIAPKLAADVIVASGDFTQRATREQFADARAFLDQLPDVPTIVTPGNHDVPLYRVLERVFHPYDLYREFIAEELDAVVRTDDAVFVSLNSTAPLRAITNGRIDAAQLAYATRAFEGTPEGAVRIVVAHHHFAPAPDYVNDPSLPRARRSLDHFQKLGVELILGGHLHRAYIGNSLDVYGGADRERGMVIVQCGTSTSRRGRGREREKNTFNLIRVSGGQIVVTHYMFFDDVGGFAPISRHLFPRPGTRIELADV
jgi:3',5'-cyclic AMP phosphodiesterase CpdA